jgi:hypothetical protein
MAVGVKGWRGVEEAMEMKVSRSMIGEWSLMR